MVQLGLIWVGVSVMVTSRSVRDVAAGGLGGAEIRAMRSEVPIRGRTERVGGKGQGHEQWQG